MSRVSPPRLFEPDELRFRRTGMARLRDMAARAGHMPVPRSRREEDSDMIERLRSGGALLASRFGLRWASLEAEQDGVTAHYGICYRDGVIRIRLRHAVTGRMLKESSLVDTLCHELAHLRHFDHSPRFRRFYLQVLDEARRIGLYRPGPVDGPRQGSLFADEDCGTAVRRRRA